MLDIERVGFVSVPTRDAARARRFYADVLGLPPSDTDPDEFVTLARWEPEADGVPFASSSSARPSTRACA